MSKAHYFYFLTPLSELERIVEAHQLDFEELVNDNFTEIELVQFEKMLDSISAIFVQPIISELTFEDFYSKESEAVKQKSFFDECKSSICLENLPDFQSNPFQITYLIELLRNFDEVLIDTGGVNELVFKKEYVDNLKKYKNIFSLIPQTETKPLEIKTTKPVDPIDFLILDVYKELDRLQNMDKTSILSVQMEGQSEKLKKTFTAMKDEKLDASMLLRKSGLNAKDFDDNLERLKFFLKKIN
jgi:hypothetical protein